MHGLRWPRSDVIAIVGVVVAAVGSIAALISIPELHDMIFGSTSPQYHSVAPLAYTETPPAPADLENEVLRTIFLFAALLASGALLVSTFGNLYSVYARFMAEAARSRLARIITAVAWKYNNRNDRPRPILLAVIAESEFTGQPPQPVAPDAAPRATETGNGEDRTTGNHHFLPFHKFCLKPRGFCANRPPGQEH